MARPGIVRLLALAAVLGVSCVAVADSRGARTAPGTEEAFREAFDAKQSAALFVGVRHFPHDTTLADVRYAVDDAVDLAFVLSLDERVRLVDPARVILSLSGEPQKPESRRHLARLVAAGAQVRPAGQIDVLTALEEQARAAGRNGLLAVAFASHGVSYDGTQYLLTASSALRHRETAISESKIREIASQSDALRSLILIDACRERLRGDQRSGMADPLSAGALIRAMTGMHGQVVLSAAVAGQYAYDDDSRRNGVFTAAVLDGLRCEAAADANGLVTIDTLAAFVEKRVVTWIRSHRGIPISRATQVSSEGRAKAMPLAVCRGTPGEPAPTVSAGIPAVREPTVREPERSRQGPDSVIQDSHGRFVPRLVAAADDAVDLARYRVEGKLSSSTTVEPDGRLQGMITARMSLDVNVITRDGVLAAAFCIESQGGGFTESAALNQALDRLGVALGERLRQGHGDR